MDSEFTETFYLLDYQFIISGYNLGTARWKRCIGQDTGKGMLSQSMLLFQNLHMFTNAEALQTLSFWGFMEASLHRYC